MTATRLARRPAGRPGRDPPLAAGGRRCAGGRGYDPAASSVRRSDRGPAAAGAGRRGRHPGRLPGLGPRNSTAGSPTPRRWRHWRPSATPTDILCVLGTWCGDSRREVPRFWRLLEIAAQPEPAPRAWWRSAAPTTTPRTRSWPTSAWAPTTGPSTASRRCRPSSSASDGREIGRIVETPVVSLGADAAAILAGEVVAPRQDLPSAECH